MNFYHHLEELNTTPVFVPSRMYDFNFISKDLLFDTKRTKQEVRKGTKECAIKLRSPKSQATKGLLATCRKISEYQLLTDVWLKEVKCNDLSEADVPIVNKEAHSVLIDKSELPTTFLRNLLRQLSKCVKLQAIWIVDV